jgi:hypothetical protein
MIGLLLLLLVSNEQKKQEAVATLKRWTKPITPEMTAWAITIRDNPGRYPMGATETKAFAGGKALARVEQHTWTFRDGKRITGKFRGVTLYELA